MASIRIAIVNIIVIMKKMIMIIIVTIMLLFIQCHRLDSRLEPDSFYDDIGI